MLKEKLFEKSFLLRKENIISIRIRNLKSLRQGKIRKMLKFIKKLFEKLFLLQKENIKSLKNPRKLRRIRKSKNLRRLRK